MAHLHEMRDSDNHFIIDPATMVITNKSKKHKLQQGDHNSEIYSFEIPRLLEGHDMTRCNLVQIHYINIKVDKTEQQSDVYKVTDMAVCDPETDTLVFTWTVHGNATQYAGSLNFRIHFYCINDKGEYTYKKHTEIFKGITISDGFDNVAAIEESYSDILSVYEARLDALEKGIITVPDYSVYFDIDVDGVVSLKEEYRGVGLEPTSTGYEHPYSISKNGLGKEGDKYNELPENLVIPDVINNIAVSAFPEAMFARNYRVKSITIPSGVRVLPPKFVQYAFNLFELNGTENIEVIEKGAFGRCGIKKALFPNLKEFSGGGHFSSAANLAIVDIGDTITAISSSCFFGCERLSLVRGGASVTEIGSKAFYQTRSLKTLSFIANVKSIGNEAFVQSRVSGNGTSTFDWWTFHQTSGCHFGDNATPADFNAGIWWKTTNQPTHCVNPLNSTFHQANPEWKDVYLPTTTGNSHGKWGDGCMEICAVNIYTALTGDNLNSPEEFIELLRGKTDEHGNLLDPVGVRDGLPAYVWDDMVRWFNAVDLDCEMLTYDTHLAPGINLKMIYEALAEGALVLSYVYPNHANVIYGVAENGEMLVLEPASHNFYLNDYTARCFQQRIWTLTTAATQAIIVKKPTTAS